MQIFQKTNKDEKFQCHNSGLILLLQPTMYWRNKLGKLKKQNLIFSKDIIATIENAVKDLEKEEADTIRANVSLTLQNSKPPKDNLSKGKRVERITIWYINCNFTRRQR